MSLTLKNGNMAQEISLRDSLESNERRLSRLDCPKIFDENCEEALGGMEKQDARYFRFGSLPEGHRSHSRRAESISAIHAASRINIGDA
jgi:hypothetical protein